MLNIVFMGTPDFAVPALKAIHSAHRVLAVYTQPDKPVGRGLELRASPVKKVAQDLGLEIRQPEKLSQPGVFEALASLKPDVIVVVAYGQILRQNVLDLPRLGCINIHSSLLPRWRGAAPIHWAMLSGDTETGVTTMKLVLKLDAGDILLQRKTPIGPSEGVEILHDRLSTLGAELVLPTLEGLENGTLTGTRQDESQVTYAAKLTKQMEWLDTAESAAKLSLKVRALNPWPGTSLAVELAPGECPRLKVKRATPRLDLNGPPGTLFERSGMLLLGTSDGALELTALQWEGKKETDIGGFLNGLKGRGLKLPLKTVCGTAPEIKT